MWSRSTRNVWPFSRVRREWRALRSIARRESSWSPVSAAHGHGPHGRALLAVAVDRVDLDLSAAVLQIHDVVHDDRAAQPRGGRVGRREVLVGVARGARYPHCLGQMAGRQLVDVDDAL